VLFDVVEIACSRFTPAVEGGFMLCSIDFSVTAAVETWQLALTVGDVMKDAGKA